MGNSKTGRTHTVLGHSDPNLTANVYTDVPALGLHAEIAKLPWISETRAYAQPDAQKSGAPWHSLALGGIIAQLVELVEAHQAKAVGHSVALPGTSWHSPLNGCPGWDRTDGRCSFATGYALGQPFQGRFFDEFYARPAIHSEAANDC